MRKACSLARWLRSLKLCLREDPHRQGQDRQELLSCTLVAVASLGDLRVSARECLLPFPVTLHSFTPLREAQAFAHARSLTLTQAAELAERCLCSSVVSPSPCSSLRLRVSASLRENALVLSRHSLLGVHPSNWTRWGRNCEMSLGRVDRFLELHRTDIPKCQM